MKHVMNVRSANFDNCHSSMNCKRMDNIQIPVWRLLSKLYGHIWMP